MTLIKDQRSAAIKWLADLPPHILREKIERGHDYGSGKTFSDKGKIMEVLQQTACIAEMLADRLTPPPILKENFSMTNNGQTPGGNTTTAGAVEMALKIVKAHYPEMPDNYRGRRYQIALAAIIETTELAAQFVERIDPVDGPMFAAAYRANDHLKGPKP